MNFQYSPHYSELNKSVDEAIQKAIRAHQIAIENLTEQQCCDVFKQAIQSGDIQKLVRLPDGGQTVIYIPFEEQQRQEFRIQELEAELKSRTVENQQQVVILCPKNERNQIMKNEPETNTHAWAEVRTCDVYRQDGKTWITITYLEGSMEFRRDIAIPDRFFHKLLAELLLLQKCVR